jgi:hypothetical protein
MTDTRERQASAALMEPTREMIRAGGKIIADRFDLALFLGEEEAEEVFRAMIAASPEYGGPR